MSQSMPTVTTRTATVKPQTGAPIHRILVDPETYATVLLVIVLDRWGLACIQGDEKEGTEPWHPTTLRMELEQAYGVRLPPENFDKLMAAIAIVTTDGFFQSAAQFIQIANVLAGDDFDPTQFEPADSVECAWAVTEALLLVPPDRDNPQPFSDEVCYYIGAVLRDEGFVKPPAVLKIAVGIDALPIEGNYSEDPEFSQALWKGQADKADEVEQVVRESLNEMFEQLMALPLQNGSTANFKQRLSKTLAQ